MKAMANWLQRNGRKTQERSVVVGAINMCNYKRWIYDCSLSAPQYRDCNGDEEHSVFTKMIIDQD